MCQRSTVNQEERADHNDLFDSQQRLVWIDWFNKFWRAISAERWTYGPFRPDAESIIIKMSFLHFGVKILISCIRFRGVLMRLFDLPIQGMSWSFVYPHTDRSCYLKEKKIYWLLVKFYNSRHPIPSLDCLSSSSSWYCMIKICKLDSTRTWHAQKNSKALYMRG